MAQIPVLFLPKGTDVKKTSVKKVPVLFDRPKKTKKIAALLKGDDSGSKKNSNENGQRRRRKPKQHSKQLT